MTDYLQLETHLTNHFNLTHFRLGQKEIIEDVMLGKDVLGVLPTGSGKSLCYQLPAKLLSGVTIVVSPLISLMTDQVRQLKSMNFKDVIALNSFMDFETRQKALRNLSAYKLIFLSPELLQQQIIQRHLQQLAINLFVIDEAHCISQWGHEFRPDYLKLNKTIQLLSNPPVLTLSATAPENVQKDIINSLERPQMVKHIYPMDRENIAFLIQKIKFNQEKVSSITNLLETYRVPTLIYFSSRKMTERVTQELTKRLHSKRIAFYHGGMEPMDRIAIQQQFMNDQLNVICCTSAFGMGIDKGNIRLVIHYHFPPNLEAFIQEVGRAGRDGQRSLSIVLYSEHDRNLPQNMIEQELPSEIQLKNVFNYLANHSNSGSISVELETELVKKFQLSEIQWRFIHYQLEKNDIINNDKIIYHPDEFQSVFDVINTHRKNRLQLKHAKLSDMISWLNETGCLREHLYKHFQIGYQRPYGNCCSNCGIPLKDWQPNQTKRKEDKHLDWHIKLKKLLFIGETNEPK